MLAVDNVTVACHNLQTVVYWNHSQPQLQPHFNVTLQSYYGGWALTSSHVVCVWSDALVTWILSTVALRSFNTGRSLSFKTPPLKSLGHLLKKSLLVVGMMLHVTIVLRYFVATLPPFSPSQHAHAGVYWHPSLLLQRFRGNTGNHQRWLYRLCDRVWSERVPACLRHHVQLWIQFLPQTDLWAVTFVLQMHTHTHTQSRTHTITQRKTYVNGIVLFLTSLFSNMVCVVSRLSGPPLGQHLCPTRSPCQGLLPPPISHLQKGH